MNFFNHKERLEKIKNNTHKMNCTIGNEGDRQGYYYEVIDTDFEWLFALIDGQRTLIESYARITEGMTEDYERAEKQLRKYERGLEEIKSLTINPKEYQPSYHTLNHIARTALEVTEVSEND